MTCCKQKVIFRVLAKVVQLLWGFWPLWVFPITLLHIHHDYMRRVVAVKLGCNLDKHTTCLRRPLLTGPFGGHLLQVLPVSIDIHSIVEYQIVVVIWLLLTYQVLEHQQHPHYQSLLATQLPQHWRWYPQQHRQRHSRRSLHLRRQLKHPPSF